MIWFILFPLSFLISIICYITNPIVLLFCDEYGELPGFLAYWQTWDDSCNPKFIMDKVPKWLQYDWDKHYEEHLDTTPELKAVGKQRWFCTIKDPNFTLKERIQRYLCRVIWLTRNCSYGFSFWFLGKKVNGNNIVVIKDVKEDNTMLEFSYDKSESIWTRAWKLKSDRWIIKDVLRWEVFCGWKYDKDNKSDHQAMIANRICFRFGHY